MKYSRTLHIVLLVAMMQPISAFKFRCYWFCSDQTAVQTDYVEDRDRCRQYAQLRIDTDTSDPELLEEKNRKSKMISLFSACMSDKGWTVPDGKGGQQASPNVPVPSPAVAAAAPVAVAAPAANMVALPNPPIVTESEMLAIQAQNREKKYLARQSECAFARHSADYSSVAATRAKACDIECAQRLKEGTNGTRPASCPPDPNSNPNNDPRY